MSARSEKLRLAQGYISRGWPTFILSSSKTPVANCDRCRAEHTTPAQMEACSCLTCHGFYSATLDLDRVAEMIRLHPRGLLAIRTGAPSGKVVVDVDAPHGIPTMRQLITDGMLPRTVVQRTGSHGYHLLYRHPGVRIPSVPGRAGPASTSRPMAGTSSLLHPCTRARVSPTHGWRRSRGSCRRSRANGWNACGNHSDRRALQGGHLLSSG